MSNQSAFQVLFIGDEEKSESADVLMTVSDGLLLSEGSIKPKTVSLMAKRGSKCEMWENLGSEEAAIEFLKAKAAEIGSDIKVICTQYDLAGNPTRCKI